MYRAKEMGRDNFQFYTPELNTKVGGLARHSTGTGSCAMLCAAAK
jgi:hypothetical protein